MDGILPPKGRKPTNATTCQLPRMLERASSNAFGRAAPSMRGAFATGVQFMCSTLPRSLPPSSRPRQSLRVVSQEAGHSLRGGFLQRHCRPRFRRLLVGVGHGVGAVRSERGSERERVGGGSNVQLGRGEGGRQTIEIPFAFGH